MTNNNDEDDDIIINIIFITENTNNDKITIYTQDEESYKINFFTLILQELLGSLLLPNIRLLSRVAFFRRNQTPIG